MRRLVPSSLHRAQRLHCIRPTSTARFSAVSPRIAVAVPANTKPLRSRDFSSCAVRLEESDEEDRIAAQMSKPGSKEPGVARPSSSVLLISPTNQVLLLHRVKSSTSFAAAHVFPGGNLDSFHDGKVPGPDDPERHVDGEAYRLAAIRETFEESGILLAKNNGFGRLIEVADAAREAGRKEVHAKKITFTKWLSAHGGRADIDNLIPFTRWITPTNLPKRFTTQMYVYFLPLATGADPYRGDAGSNLGTVSESSSGEALIPVPTHDGGVEHTAARFLPAAKWISMAESGEIILFPPQFFLLTMVGQFLKPVVDKGEEASPSQLKAQRQELRKFLKTGDPPWGEMCMSPTQVAKSKKDGKSILGLDKPGPELKDSNRRGVKEYIVKTNFTKQGPRNVEVRKRTEVMEEERQLKEKL